jgi:hypothetical protein
VKKAYEVFLGGADREMDEIKEIAIKAGVVVYDKGLSWGAKASSYEKEISALLLCNSYKFAETSAYHRSHQEFTDIVPVFIELEIDIDLPNGSIVINHHDELSGNPPAIIQFCSLLGVKPTRQQNLIGAMDAGYVFGLEAFGASKNEIAEFLGTKEGSVSNMLIESENHSEDTINEVNRAIKDAEYAVLGDLIVVRCAHNTTSPITARLHGKQNFQNILILSEWEEDGETKKEANFYGTGAQIRDIKKIMNTGWTGGAGLNPPTEESKKYWEQEGGRCPDTAFFGCTGVHQGKVLKAVLSAQPFPFEKHGQKKTYKKKMSGVYMGGGGTRYELTSDELSQRYRNSM